MASGVLKRFVDWEERFVSHDRGSRVVHYYLRDRHGHQCLAVIGTERSLRHMVYVVCDDFLPVAGLDKSTTSAFKWRARREVVDWLSSFLGRPRAADASHSAGSPRNMLQSPTDADGAPSYEGAEGMESSQEECRSRHHDMETRKHCFSSKADVIWVGSAWSCRKRLRHFHSFQRNGITISVKDFVYVMTEEKDRHIAYVEDLFEDKKLRKKLRVRWFHKTSELTCRIPPPVPHHREVFYTAFEQDLSVECVDGVATVLTPEHHEVCLAAVPSDTMAQALICYRQFDNEGIKPFNIQNVKGYWQQTVLSLAGIVSRHNSPQSDLGSEDLEIDEDEVAETGRVIRRGPRTARCSRRRAGLGNRITRSTGDGAADMTCVSGDAGLNGCADGKNLSSNRGRSDEGDDSQELWRYDVGDKIEMLSEDSGLRGCWFKGTVLRRGFRRLQVRYDDVLSEDGDGNLEEWISSCKTAGPCKLGIRISGRPSIRPSAPEMYCSLRLNEGEIVDAWWHDGWWEGIICGSDSSGLVHVHLAGEQETELFKECDLRISREWLNGTWAAIPSYPDIVASLGLSVRGVKVLGQDFGVLPMESSLTISKDKCVSPVRELCTSAVKKSQTDALVSSIDFCSLPVREEHFAVPVAIAVGSACRQCAEPQLTLPYQTAGSPKCAEEHNAKDAIYRVKQEHQDVGGNLGSKQSRMAVSSLGLKWKAGRKRHRQGDLVTSRVDKSSAHCPSEVKEESSFGSLREEVSCGRNMDGAIVPGDMENVRRWQNGDGEEVVKPKKLRQGNDSSLKSLHGTPMVGSSIFMGAMPIANLVMSR